MGVQVNLRVSKGSSQLLHAVRGAPLREFVSKVLRVICRAHRWAKGSDLSTLTHFLKAQCEHLYLSQNPRNIRDEPAFVTGAVNPKMKTCAFEVGLDGSLASGASLKIQMLSNAFCIAVKTTSADSRLIAFRRPSFNSACARADIYLRLALRCIEYAAR